MPELPTGTVTFLFTDLEGSTRLWQEHPDAMQPALARHDEILRDAITAHDGHIVKTTGDGAHAAFGDATAAVRAAIDAQRALGTEAWGTTGPLGVRMGVHTGPAEQRDGDYYGTAVNRAARLMSAAHAGQVVVSLTTEELLRDAMPDEWSIVDLGEHRLRDLSRAERVFQLAVPGLQREFPPLQSLDAFPGNLPLQLSSFVGRDAELTAVAKELSRSRLVTLIGVGGVGKTRLALQVAGEIVPDYSNGVWLCELASAGDPESMLQLVAATLGASPRPGMSLGASIAEFLRARELLLVLDNCEHLLDATARLVDDILREAPKVRILATSREGLGVEGERVMPLRSLPLPAPTFSHLDEIATADAVRLFGERADAARPGFSLEIGNAPAVVDICCRLDGMPLAIELAAARIAAMSPAEVSERLDERFRLLTGGRRTAVERHHTLRATVDWSYSLLTPIEQRVFDRLGVFAGSFDTSATEAVVASEGIEEWDVVDALSSLVAKSMVNADETPDGTTRYELLETLRAYARERLDEEGRPDEYRRRHAEYYAGFAERAGRGLIGPDEFAWRRLLHADLANLRAAVTWALDRDGEGEAAVRIVAGLAPEALNDRAAGVGTWAEHTRAAAGASTPGRRSAVFAAAAWHAFSLGDYTTARDLAQDAVDAEPIADCAVPSFAYSVLSSAEAFVGHAERAKEVLDEGARVTGLVDDRFGHLQFLATEAIVDASRDDYAAARVSAAEGLRLAHELGNPTAKAITLGVLGWALFRDDPHAAAAAFEESIALTRAGAGDATFQTSLGLVAPLRARVGDVEGGLHAVREALTRARDNGDLASIGASLGAAVEVAFTAADTDLAAIYAGMVDSDAFRVFLYPNDPHLPERRRVLDRVRADLGEEQYALCLAQGAAMSYDEGMDYALSELDRMTREIQGA